MGSYRGAVALQCQRLWMLDSRHRASLCRRERNLLQSMQDRPLSLFTGRWYLLIVAVYLTGILSLGVALRHNVGFPLDDSWIHQEIARNLVQFHSFGFTPGVTSSGSSSTLWTLILSLNYLLFPTHSPVFFPLI